MVRLKISLAIVALLSRTLAAMEPEIIPQENQHKIITLKATKDEKCLSIDQSLLINCWGSTFTKTKEGTDGVIPFAFDSALFPLLEKALYTVELFKDFKADEKYQNMFLSILQLQSFKELFKLKPALTTQAKAMFDFFAIPLGLRKALDQQIGYIAGAENFDIEEITVGLSFEDLIRHPELLRKNWLTNLGPRHKPEIKLDFSGYNLTSTKGFNHFFSEHGLIFDAIKEINLSNNKLTDLSADFFDAHDRSPEPVALLNLSHNQFTQFPLTLLDSDLAQCLNFSYNKLESIDDFGDEEISLRHLQDLDLSNNELTDLSNSFLNTSDSERAVNNSSIKTVNLANNKISFLPSHFVSQLKGIKKIILTGNPLKDDSISAFSAEIQAAIKAGDSWYKEHSTTQAQ